MVSDVRQSLGVKFVDSEADNCEADSRASLDTEHQAESRANPVYIVVSIPGIIESAAAKVSMELVINNVMVCIHRGPC